MKPLILVIVLAALAGFGALFYYNVQTENDRATGCPTHWHATFAVFVPDKAGEPVRIDFGTPKAANGNPYYDLNGGAGMGIALHMHLDPRSAERGSAALGPAQWHMEGMGQCVSVKSALHIVEVDATATSLHLFGAHAQVHQDGTWTASGDQRLRYWVESEDKGNWTWHERSWDDVKGYQLKDGESFLAAFGNYSDAQVKAMESQIPAPISRVHVTQSSVPTT
jgi:hypothetical protein